MEKAVSRSEEKEDEFKLGRELWLVAKAALPVIVAEFCRLFMNVIDSIFIGQLGARELAAASLGTSWGWCSLAIPVGLIFALDTFVSQGFGAQNWRLIGASTQTAVFVVTLATIPVALLWWFTEPILLGLRQPPEVVVLTAEYMRWGLPGLWPILFYRLTTRYLMNQWILMPGMVAGIIAVCGNALFNQLFIFWLGLGFKGGPLATSVSRILLPIYLWIYIILRKIYSKTCTGIYREAFTFRAVWEFLKLGIPSMGSLWLETLAYEGVALLVGLFGGDTNLAAYSISYAVLTVSFILPLGWAIGAQTRVGNLLGAGNSKKAQKVARLMITFGLSWMLGQATLIYLLRNPTARIFTNSTAVLEISDKLMFISAIIAIFDGMSTILCGQLRAIGRPLPGSVAMFLGHYLAGLPSGITLGFWFKLEIYGVMLGLAIGLATSCAIIAFYVWKTDWEKMTQEALKRTSKTDAQKETSNEPEGKTKNKRRRA